MTKGNLPARVAVLASMLIFTFAIGGILSSILSMFMGGSALWGTVHVGAEALVCTLTLGAMIAMSPDSDPLYYWNDTQERLIERIMLTRHRRGLARGLRDDRARMAAVGVAPVDVIERTPEQQAWDAMLRVHAPIAADIVTQRQDLRRRADAMLTLLADSVETADLDAVVMLTTTIVRLSQAYEQSMARQPDEEGARHVHETLNRTLDTVVSAAESRRAAVSATANDSFDEVVRHAVNSAQRVSGVTGYDL